jgi:hypothetical protein
VNGGSSPRNKRPYMQSSPRHRHAALSLAAALTAVGAASRAHADPDPVTMGAPAPQPPVTTAAPVLDLPAPDPAVAPPATPAAPVAPVTYPGELQFSTVFGGEGSSWAGDGAGFAGIKAGFRFRDLIAPYFVARAGYATVNQRVLEMIQLGVQIWARLGITRPYFRLGMLHQHEESWAAYKVDYIGSFLGVADGINHRDGGEFAIGVDVPVKQYHAWQFHLTFDALATVFPPDQRGPRVYGGGIFGVGFNYGL